MTLLPSSLIAREILAWLSPSERDKPTALETPDTSSSLDIKDARLVVIF